MVLTLDTSAAAAGAAPAASSDAGKPSLAGLGRDGLRAALAAIGVPEKQLRMRVGQLWSWIYVRGVTSFDDMTDVSKELRATLARSAITLDRPEIVSRAGVGRRHAQVAAAAARAAATRRARPRSRPSTSPRPTAARCASRARSAARSPARSATPARSGSCATSTPEEIVGQILLARDRIGDWPGAQRAAATARLLPDTERKITNVVLMGMGEPLYNFDNVSAAMEVAADGDGLSVSKRRITLSTSGVVPEIPRWGDEAGTMLAISLHAVRDELRDELVPINKQVSDRRAAGGLPQLSGPVERAPHHLRVRDAEGRQRQPRRRPGAGAAAGRHPGQDQPHPVQSVARHARTSARTGSRSSASPRSSTGRLREPGAHAARSRHPGRLRAAEVGEREAARQRAARSMRQRAAAGPDETCSGRPLGRMLIVIPFALAAGGAGRRVLRAGDARAGTHHAFHARQSDRRRGAETHLRPDEPGVAAGAERHAHAGAADGHHRRDRPHPLAGSTTWSAAGWRWRRFRCWRAIGQGGAIASPEALVWQVFATAGFAGGFVYWLLAGRNA